MTTQGKVYHLSSTNLCHANGPASVAQRRFLWLGLFVLQLTTIQLLVLQHRSMRRNGNLTAPPQARTVRFRAGSTARPCRLCGSNWFSRVQRAQKFRLAGVLSALQLRHLLRQVLTFSVILSAKQQSWELLCLRKATHRASHQSYVSPYILGMAFHCPQLKAHGFWCTSKALERDFHRQTQPNVRFRRRRTSVPSQCTYKCIIVGSTALYLPLTLHSALYPTAMNARTDFVTLQFPLIKDVGMADSLWTVTDAFHHSAVTRTH